MNRYIKTRDGVIDLIKNCRGNSISHYEKDEAAPGWCAGWYSHIEEYDGTQLEVRDDEIVAQADTIEELCDWYFAMSNTGYKTSIKIDFEKKIVEQWQDIIVEYPLDHFIQTHTIYGAIWTDKGLIYVAKMNEKGELELL